MDINHNLIIGCHLCDVFSHIDEYELIYPKTKQDISKVDFIIVKCKLCDRYLLILRDHTEFVTNEMFGKILYFVRKLLSHVVKIDTNIQHCKDHFHCHIDVK